MKRATSLGAQPTPMTLWKEVWFPKGTKPPAAAKRMVSLLSTMHGKHGGKHGESTEVPRTHLVNALKRNTRLASTEGLKVAATWFGDDVTSARR